MPEWQRKVLNFLPLPPGHYSSTPQTTGSVAPGRRESTPLECECSRNGGKCPAVQHTIRSSLLIEKATTTSSHPPNQQEGPPAVVMQTIVLRLNDGTEVADASIILLQAYRFVPAYYGACILQAGERTIALIMCTTDRQPSRIIIIVVLVAVVVVVVGRCALLWISVFANARCHQ